MDFDFVYFYEIGLLVVIEILILDPYLLVFFELAMVVDHISFVNLEKLRGTEGMKVLIMAVFCFYFSTGMLTHSQNIDPLLRKNHKIIVSVHETPDS